MPLVQTNEAIAKFSMKFLNQMERGKSVVLSPLSAEFVLALLTLGTTEPAHSELLSAMGFPNDETIRSSFSELTSKARNIKGITLHVANKIYLKDGSYTINSQLHQDAVVIFNADLEKLNFGNSAKAATVINSWVESKTENKIKDLLSPDCFNDDTRLVIVNAIYFKGLWRKQFSVHCTTDQLFNVNIKDQKYLPMMFQESRFNYGFCEELDAQFLELPYEGNDTSMVIVLPKEIEGLNFLLKKLADGYDLLGYMLKMKEVKVRVSLPKFKIETEIDLAKVLPKLGISEIFIPTGEGLDKILIPREKLYVSKAVQKAFIEVNEEGAEAAAATAVVRLGASAVVDLDPVQQFVADRPFLAMIMIGKSPYFFATFNGN